MSWIDYTRFVVFQVMFWAAAAVFADPLKKRPYFWRRLGVFFFVVIIYSGFLIHMLGQCRLGTELPIRIVSGILMVFFLSWGWESHSSISVYNAVWSVSVWQLLREVCSFIEYRGASFFTRYPVLLFAGIVILYSVVYIILAHTIAIWMPDGRKDRIGPRQLLSAVLIFLLIEVLAYSQELRHISEYTGEWKFLFVSQVLGLIVLYLQSELFKKSAIREELALMNLLWKNKQEQYTLAKENINLINQKSHDLKHQIRALRKVSKEEFDRYLNEMDDAIQIYDSIVHTGNDVLDTILTEKSLYCKNREIQVSCVADGSQMDFIGKIDLYAILGNAMDNAIEAVEKFKKPEKRQIDVIICRQQNFLIMNFINPLEGSLVFDEEGELPLTSKGDKGFHGFGLRSIRHFVRKYDGVVNITDEDDCFSLKIMIPIPAKQEV